MTAHNREQAPSCKGSTAYTYHFHGIYEVVGASGLPNCLVARVPLPMNLNLREWKNFVHIRDDTAVV